jgi:hypothetical protein
MTGLVVTRVGISLWNPDPGLRIPERPSVCPICGLSDFAPGERLSALLNPLFDNGFSYVEGVWVHRACFESCPETIEPDPVPW